MRVLIIEDDAAFARTLGRSFERRGYTVFQERVSVPTVRKLMVLGAGLLSGFLARRRAGTQRA